MPRRDNRTNEGVIINLKTYILLRLIATRCYISICTGSFCCMLFTVDIVIFTFLFVCIKIVMLIIPKLLILFFTQTCMCTYTIIMEGADHLYLFRKSLHSCLSLKS